MSGRVTHIGYFGPTSNVKAAPDALTPDVVGALLGALPPKRPAEPRPEDQLALPRAVRDLARRAVPANDTDAPHAG